MKIMNDHSKILNLCTFSRAISSSSGCHVAKCVGCKKHHPCHSPLGAEHLASIAGEL